MAISAKKVFPVAFFAFILPLAHQVVAAELWVSTRGNDSRDCSSADTGACRTIQKAVSLAGPGDTVFIQQGTYLEDSSNSKYTERCAWIGDLTASICLRKSGTPDNMITIRSAPGDEGKVIIDNQNVRVGIHTLASDYIHIYGLTLTNSRVIGIASWGQATVEVPDEALLGVGLIIENNRFYNTTGKEGMNTSAIGMWGSRNWVVKDNFINGVSAEGSTLAAGIQAYGVINALIEHNEIYNADFGIYWKDHHFADQQRSLNLESEIRFNKINGTTHGVYVSARQGSTPAGHNLIHHNIIYGYSGSGFRGNVAAAAGKSGEISITHNVFDGHNIHGNAAITLDGQGPAEISGNIIIRNDIDLDIRKYSSQYFTVLNDINYNIYDQEFQSIIDRFNPSSMTIRSFSNWQSLEKKRTTTLGHDYPDKKSLSVSPHEVLKNLDDKNYRLAEDSEAIGFMPDGSNAGPYAKGDEVVGILRSTTLVNSGRPSSAPPGAPPKLHVE